MTDRTAPAAPDDPSAAAPDDPSAAEAAPPARTDWWAEVRGLLWLVLAVLGFHTLVAKPFYIPSESMMPGLLVGDRLVVTKFPYGYSWVSPTLPVLPFIPGRLFGSLPRRGDVVIVTPPGRSVDWIKRVVGLPGDRIAVRGGALYLNGQAVPRRRLDDRLVPIDANTRCAAQGDVAETGADGRRYCRLEVWRETLPGGRSYDTIEGGFSFGDNFDEYRVPAGHVFLMGDNRDNSADSRFALADDGLGGAVPWENIGGRAEFVTFSLDGSATLDPRTWFASLRGDRAGLSLHPMTEDRR